MGNLVLVLGQAALGAVKSGDPVKKSWAAATIKGGGLSLLGTSAQRPAKVSGKRKDGSVVEFQTSSSGSVAFAGLPADVQAALIGGKGVLIRDPKVEAGQALTDGEVIDLV
jgi:hypothetical protein